MQKLQVIGHATALYPTVPWQQKVSRKDKKLSSGTRINEAYLCQNYNTKVSPILINLSSMCTWTATKMFSLKVYGVCTGSNKVIAVR